MNLIIVGAAGAGKGTVSEEILKKYHIAHISTGDMFREQIARKTSLGQLAKTHIDRGDLVPDDVTIQLVKDRLLQDDCRKGYLLDGFPRTLHQAQALQKMLDETHLNLDAVLYLEVEFDRLIRRVTGRRICVSCKSVYHVEFSPSIVPGICDKCSGRLYQRTDDTETSLRERLHSFMEDTRPVLDFFQAKNLVQTVDGNQPIAEVSASVFEVLEGLYQ